VIENRTFIQKTSLRELIDHAPSIAGESAGRRKRNTRKKRERHQSGKTSAQKKDDAVEGECYQSNKKNYYWKRRDSRADAERTIRTATAASTQRMQNLRSGRVVCHIRVHFRKGRMRGRDLVRARKTVGHQRGEPGTARHEAC